MAYNAPLALSMSPASGWIPILDDIPKRSFASYKPVALNKELSQFYGDKCINSLPWDRPIIRGSPLNRKACWLTSSPCTCCYDYSGTSWPSNRFPPWMVDLTTIVSSLCGFTSQPNACNVNLYDGGFDAVGWHADDEEIFDAVRTPTTIVSLSLGVTRLFEFSPRENLSMVSRIELGNGDLLTMEGLMQKHYLHRVPVQNSLDGVRVNITWRWILKHQGHCPLCVQSSSDLALPSSNRVWTSRAVRN